MVQNLGLNFPMTTQQWNTLPADIYISGLEKLDFLVHEICAPQSNFRRMLCTSNFCSPCDFSRYGCSPHRVPRRAPNEVSYGKMNQYNKIL